MRKALALYVKLFGLTTFLFVGGILLVFGSGAWMALFTGAVCYGFLMALFLGTSQIWATKRVGSLKDLGVRQARLLTVEGTMRSVRPKCLEIMKEIGAKPEHTRKANYIRARRRNSWRHPGQKIEIRLLQERDGVVDLVVLSRPRTFTVMVDGATNLKTVIEIEKRLKAVGR